MDQVKRSFVWRKMVCAVMAAVLLITGAAAALGTGAREADAAGVTNLVVNPGFENGLSEDGIPVGWDYNGPTGTLSLGSGNGNVHSGAASASFWSGSDYEFTLTQTITGLDDGEYVLKAWASGNAGNGPIELFADGFGGERLKTDIVNANWGTIAPYTVGSIEVTNGQATIGFSVDVAGGYWGFFDDVEFYKADESETPVVPDEFIKGADISTLQSIEDAGGKYYDNGQEKDLLEILKDHGVNYIRLRIWNNPVEAGGSDEQGQGGYNDLAHTIEMAKRVKEAGLKLLLDFHYSDFWADPGKQVKPAAWADLDYEGLKQAVYDYTADTLDGLAEEGAYPDMVQIGNEINNGMLLPDGSTSNYDQLAELLKSGIQAVRDTTPDGQTTKIMIHLAEGGNKGKFQDFFDNIISRGVDFDVIGASYYPFWHGTPQDLKTNLDSLASRYGKQVVVAENSYGYTLQDGDGFANSFTQTAAEEAGFPATVDGQKAEVETVLNTVAHVPDGLGLGVFYWEPAWIPVPKDSEGGYQAGWKKGEGNAWDNQAMFDFQGNALPSLDAFQFDRDNLPADEALFAYAPEGVTIGVNKPVEEAAEELPATVDVLHNDGSVVAQAVDWQPLDEDTLSNVGDFTLTGAVEGTDFSTQVTVTVSPHQNILVNPGFETGDNTGWTVEGTASTASGKQALGDSYKGKGAFNYYSADSFELTLSQELTDIPNGTYVLKSKVSGSDGGDAIHLFAMTGEDEYVSEPIVNAGWKAWQDGSITEIQVANNSITVGLSIVGTPGAWGWVDNFELYRDVELPEWGASKELKAAQATSNSIKLSWSGASHPEQIAGYKIYKDGQRIASVAGTASEYTVTGLAANTSYRFKVEASYDAAIWTSTGPEALLKTKASSTTTSTGPTETTEPQLPAGFETVPATAFSGSGATVTFQAAEGTTFIQLPANVSQLLNGRSLTLTAEGATLVLPASVLKQLEGKLAGDGVVTVQMKPLDTNSLKELQAQLGSRADIDWLSSVYDFKLTIVSKDGGSVQELSEFADPIELRVTADRPSSTAGIFYLNSRNEPEYVGGKWENGFYSAKLSHFSRYALLDIDKSFVDVPEKHWAYEAIRSLAAKQYVQGVTADRFEPGRTITRAEFAALLARALGLEAGDPAASGFADVPASAWYAADVAAAAEHGIVAGRGGQLFDPSGEITREEMAVMASKAAALLSGGEPAATGGAAAVFADESQVSAWAAKYVQASVAWKLLQGVGGNRFAPQGHATRAEAAQLLANLLKLAK
ncbi:glycosyl hydrolase 53 family protein [Cohnella sp. AR92]|uniref:glycosyl hydrolase 53 family protein n=1 Tax=Cohnella sp. AR92 TaxID=648716 RepID=UPI000F8EA876|nr:glycosyl hydrolase 53 family protein [Cohnella sp. AR92]RUS46575.1 hypothetical protein ELR57_12790 [Cohnella sp. AR92]